MKKWVISFKVNHGNMIYEEHYECTSNFGAIHKFYNDIVKGIFSIDDPEEVTSFSIKEEV